MYAISLITLISIYYFYSKKNEKQFGPISFLIVVYLIMGVVAIILEFSGIFPSVYPFALTPMLYLSISFLIVFSGFFSFRDRNLIAIKIENQKLYRIFESSVMYGGFCALLFFLPFAITGLSGDVELNRLGVFDFQENVLAKYGIFNSIFSLFANLFIFAILFSFIRFSDKDNIKSQIMGYLLLVSSFSYVVYVLAYVGRDGIVYWLMSYSFIYLLFKRFVPQAVKKKLFYQYFILIGVFIVPFMIISHSPLFNNGRRCWMAIIRIRGMPA